MKLTDVARKQTTELTAIGGTATVPGGTDPITFRVLATAGGPVTAEGQIGGENKATLDANEFDLSALAPALRHFAPDVAAGGKLRGKFAASWSPAEKGLPAFTADGELHISQMVLSAPALGDRPVQLASAAMPLSATFDGKVLKVARWNVTCDVGTLGFAGEYDTAATPETLLNQTGLSSTPTSIWRNSAGSPLACYGSSLEPNSPAAG